MNIILILDASGSIQPYKESYLSMVNEIITQQRDKVDANAKLSLHMFNQRMTTFHRNIPLHSVPEFTPEDYHPDGLTALYDAVGTVIDTQKDSPGDSICVIFTDGVENASTKFTQKQIFTKITALEEAGKWSFIFMGANIDSWDVGKKLGINKDKVYCYSNSKNSLDKVARQANLAIGRGYCLMTQEDNELADEYDEDCCYCLADDDDDY